MDDPRTSEQSGFKIGGPSDFSSPIPSPNPYYRRLISTTVSSADGHRLPFAFGAFQDTLLKRCMIQGQVAGPRLRVSATVGILAGSESAWARVGRLLCRERVDLIAWTFETGHSCQCADGTSAPLIERQMHDIEQSHSSQKCSAMLHAAQAVRPWRNAGVMHAYLPTQVGTIGSQAVKIYRQLQIAPY